MLEWEKVGTSEELWGVTDEEMEFNQWCGDIFIVFPLIIRFVC